MEKDAAMAFRNIFEGMTKVNRFYKEICSILNFTLIKNTKYGEARDRKWVKSGYMPCTGIWTQIQRKFQKSREWIDWLVEKKQVTPPSS